MPEIGNGMKLRIGPCKNRGVRNRSQWRLRVGAVKNDTLSRNYIQIRSDSMGVSEKAHAIGTRSIYRDENNIRSFCPERETEPKKEQPDQRSPHKQQGSLPSAHSLNRFISESEIDSNAELHVPLRSRTQYRVEANANVGSGEQGTK
jgi:hypothetical protein